MSRIAFALVAVAGTIVTANVTVTDSAQAQYQPRKWPLSTWANVCAQRLYNADRCGRTIEFARSRYGNEVSQAEWNSAASAVGYKIYRGR
jgi:hypothetical protein